MEINTGEHKVNENLLRNSINEDSSEDANLQNENIIMDYNRMTSLQYNNYIEKRPLEIIKILFRICGDPQKLCPTLWSSDQKKDYIYFFESLYMLDQTSIEIFQNLYTKTHLDRVWFQKKNSLLCKYLEQFNEDFVRLTAPIGNGIFEIADILLLGTLQRLFKFILMKNYRENNISELTLWYIKMSQLKEFKQSFGVAKFCAGSIDDLYKFDSDSKLKNRKKKVQKIHKDFLNEDQMEEQSEKSCSDSEKFFIFEDGNFDLIVFKDAIKDYFNQEKDELFKNPELPMTLLSNFDSEKMSVFMINRDTDNVPEEGLEGCDFLEEFKNSGEIFLFFLFLYKKSNKRDTINHRISNGSEDELTDYDIDRENDEYSSANQSESEQYEDENLEDSRDMRLRGILIYEPSEKLKKIREGLMMVFNQFEGAQAKTCIERIFFKTQIMDKHWVII